MYNYVHWISQNALAHFYLNEIIDFIAVPNQKSFGFLVKDYDSNTHIFYCYQSTVKRFSFEVYVLIHNSFIFPHLSLSPSFPPPLHTSLVCC